MKSCNHFAVTLANKLNSDYTARLHCSIHGDYASQFWCKTCQVQICASCVAKDHTDHDLSNVISMLGHKRDAMMKELTIIYNKKPELEHGLLRTQETISQYFNDMDKIGQQLTKRTTEMHIHVDTQLSSHNESDMVQTRNATKTHEDIEAIFSSRRQALQKMVEADLNKLLNLERVITCDLKQMSEDIRRIEDQLSDEDPNTPLLFQEANVEKSFTSADGIVAFPTFIVDQPNATSLDDMFGKLQTQQSKYSVHKSSSCQLNTAQTWKSDDVRIIPMPLVDSGFVVNTQVPLLICAGSGKAWVKNDENWIYLVNKEGSVEDAVRVNCSFHDMACTSEGNLLLTDYNNLCIQQVETSGKMTKLIDNLPRSPLAVFASTEYIFVTFPSGQVSEYGIQGNYIRSTYIKWCYPFRVSWNPVNDYLFICDMDHWYLESAGSVIVVDRERKIRSGYYGQVDNKFTPREVCADHIGNVLVTDYINRKVHILDKEGQFLQYLLTSDQGLRRPCTISVDNEGCAWVGEFVLGCKGIVKIAKYLH